MRTDILFCLVILAIISYLTHHVQSADCTGRIEKYTVNQPSTCTKRVSSGGWWRRRGRRREQSYICNKVVEKSRLILTSSCDGCGGCGSGSALTTQRACNVDTSAKQSYVATSVCSYRVRRRRWSRRRITKYKSCTKTQYRTTTVNHIYCCTGFTLSGNTCRKSAECGVNKFGVLGTLSAQKDSSGNVTLLIVGGNMATYGQFPWQVRLSIAKVSDRSVCGGTIIGSRWILTAAHCVDGSKASISYAYVGDHMISTTESSEVRHTFDRVHIHPSYQSGTTVTSYDIALIRTRDLISYTDYARPACLPSDPGYYLGRQIVISGWGRTESGGSGGASDALKYTLGNVVSDSACGSSSYINKLCATGWQGSTSCNGDSGGPLTVKEDGRATVIGVAWSGDEGCPINKAFLYTDVGPYVPWIRNTIIV